MRKSNGKSDGKPVKSGVAEGGQALALGRARVLAGGDGTGGGWDARSLTRGLHLLVRGRAEERANGTLLCKPGPKAWLETHFKPQSLGWLLLH